MNMNLKNLKRSKFPSASKGFTLVETLVAIAIFAFAITGLISITARGVFNTNFVKNKFTAGYLALEGAELVRNVRDSAAIDGVTTWAQVMTDDSLLGHCTEAGGACYIDPNPSSFDLQPAPCPSLADCPYMKYLEAEARFNYAPADNITNFESIFKRTITVEEIVSGVEARVISRVEWTQGNEIRSVEFVYNMLHWAGQ